MSPMAARILAATAGVVTMLGAGVLAGGWTWVAAGAGAIAAAGAVFDRQLHLAQVLAALAVTVAVVATDRDWYVAVLAAGTVGSIELAALADRTNLVRPRVPRPAGALITAGVAGALTGAVLLVGQLRLPAASAGVVLAGVAAVVSLRVTAR